jgi:dTDP-N-acetylfucosamine:lipid II N-acetylfucosaminyltransferase
MRKIKIAHIAPDEKFIEMAVETFELVYPNQNKFYITSSKPWTYIKNRSIYKELNNRELLKQLLMSRSELKSYDLIIFHGLPSIYLLPLVLLKQRYVWLGWGYDYYNRTFGGDLLSFSLFLPKTESIIAEIKGNKVIDNKSFYSPSYLVKRIINSKFFYKLGMKNLNVFSPVLPQEYNMVKEKFGLGKCTKYYPWNYGILERHFIKSIKLDGIDNAKSILLGNSATPTNNHCEALDILAKSLKPRTVYIPLSYGCMKYARYVKEYIANNKLLHQSIVLDTFIELEDYNNILNNCGFVIMNHVRQQALGNIVAMMYRGSKIFIREESVVYKYFKDQKANIFSIQELEANISLLDFPLTLKEIEYNRSILRGTWSESVIIARTKELVSQAIL